jgi:hypothetical protein
VFTARYALSPYIKQIRFVFRGLMSQTYCLASPLAAGRKLRTESKRSGSAADKCKFYDVTVLVTTVIRMAMMITVII